MEEWLSLDAVSAPPRRLLAAEALQFVRGARGRGPLTGPVKLVAHPLTGPIGSPCPAR